MRCGSSSLLTRVAGDGEEAWWPGKTEGGGVAMRGETARDAAIPFIRHPTATHRKMLCSGLGQKRGVRPAS